MTQELHRPLLADRVGASPVAHLVEADAAECAALAQRMQVPEIRSLRCEFRLVRLTASVLLAEGHLRAELVQICVLTLEEFPALVDERFRVRFVPEGSESEDADPESDDEIGYGDGMLDLGEAAAQQLALALDPYPRAPGAELPEIAVEADEHPFAALRRGH